MRIHNVHERLIEAPELEVGRLLDSLASPEDQLWPTDRWPRMVLDGPLGPGASGGHGPIRYVVEAYEPGRSVRFRFTRPPGFVGHHCFELEAVSADQTRLRHSIEMHAHGLTWLKWALVIRHLHDALLEDALDRAETSLGAGLPQQRHSLRVCALRWMLSRIGPSGSASALTRDRGRVR